MVCRICGSHLADDTELCYNCGTHQSEIVENPIRPESAPAQAIEDIAKYDIVLVEINASEELIEKAHMAIAYILYEDKIMKTASGSNPEPDVKQQIQDESIEKAYEIAKSIPVALKKAVRKKEALFFKERLARYGVIVLNGYCPDCGGSLNETSEKCMKCGHDAVELIDSNIIAAAERPDEQILGELNVFCPECGTLSQGVAEFCRKCGNKTGDKAFPEQSTQEEDVAAESTAIKTHKKSIKEHFLVAAGLISIAATVIITIMFI